MRDRATEYARLVVAGKVVACKPHIQSCQRHLNDLARQGDDDFEYIWKPELSDRILRFAEKLVLIEGKKPQRLKLFPSQCFDLGVPFGWVDKEGYRRFRRKYITKARQNGKSLENGVTAGYIAGFCGYKEGKLFAAATKQRQAKITWNELYKFIKGDEELAEFFKVQEYKNLITNKLTGCTIEALSKDSGLDDGFRSIFNSIDEIHQHKDNSVYKALYDGTRALPETLNSMIQHVVRI